MGRLTIRAALFLGFGLILGLWLLTGYQFTQRMAELESRSNAINAHYTYGQNLLSTVRAQILLGSIYVRDALLDPDPTGAASYRTQLEESYRAADQALRLYMPMVDSRDERERISHLKREVEGFKDTMLRHVLTATEAQRRSEVRAILRTEIIPKREAVILVSDEVQALNRSSFVQQQAEVADMHRATQRQIWVRLGIALAASLGIALLAAAYAGRLEDRIRRQSERDVQNARDLQRLSAKLIHAEEEERRTIARELHDEVGQVLTALKVELAVAQRTVQAAGGPAQALANVRSITDGAIQTVRDLSRLLHPAMLDDLGLPAAIDAHLKGFGSRHGIRVTLEHDGMGERLASESETALYRIVQEGLTNVARHARATTVHVSLKRLPNTVLMTLEDNGVGFDAASVDRTANPGGLGLIGIRERVANLRGTLRLESAPGKGTRLAVVVPARAREDTPEERRAAASSPEAVHG